MNDPTVEATAPSSRQLTLLFAAACAVGLAADLANLLNFHHYPVARPEVAAMVAILLGIAAVLTGLHRLMQPRLSYLLSGLVIALLIDLGADITMPVFLVVVGVIALLARFSEGAVLKLTLAAFGSVLLFQSFDLLFGTVPAPRNEAGHLQAAMRPESTRPPIVHLMLDSYIGLEGMTAPGTNFGDLRSRQEAFYLGHGFQIYPGSYSRHPKTINALPEFLSYGRAAHATTPRNVQFTEAAELPYFADLDRVGYRTSALTPSFVDLCPNQPLTACRNYNRSNLAAMIGTDLSVADRTRLIGINLLELAPFTAVMAGKADLALGEGRSAGRHLHNRDKLLSLSGFAELDAVTRDLASLKFGEARFIHLLVPHDPYIYDERCRLQPESDWVDEHGPAPIAHRDATYARQVRCMTEHRLAGVLAALDATPAGRAAIVIVQGDHGSRTIDAIPDASGAVPDARSMAVMYSAFFAVRVPGEAAATVPGRFALDQLVGGFAAADFSHAPRPQAGPAEVWMMNKDWLPMRRVALPPFAAGFKQN